MDTDYKSFKEWLFAGSPTRQGYEAPRAGETEDQTAFPVVNYSRPLLSRPARMAADFADPYLSLIKVTPAYWRVVLADPPLNRINSRFFRDFFALVEQIERDSQVKVVVFESASPDFFLGDFDLGSDLHPDLRPRGLRLDNADFRDHLRELRAQWWPHVLRLAHAPVLTVASIRGRCRGAGASFAATLDVRLASRERCVLSQPEAGLPGSTPGFGALEVLPSLVGRGRTMEIVLGADDFDADTAERYGWVNRAVPDAELVPAVERLARRVASWDKPVIARTKALVNRRCGLPGVGPWLESFDAFSDCVQDGPDSRRRVTRAVELGWQTYGDLDLNMAWHLPHLLESYGLNISVSGYDFAPTACSATALTYQNLGNVSRTACAEDDAFSFGFTIFPGDGGAELDIWWEFTSHGELAGTYAISAAELPLLGTATGIYQENTGPQEFVVTDVVEETS